MSIEPQKNWRRYPPPVADMTRENAEEEAQPRTIGAGATADWNMGAAGNDIDDNFRSQPIAPLPPSGPPPWLSQWDKAEVLGVGYAADIGTDYGQFTGLNGREGDIQPFQPYPVTVEATTVTPDAFLPSQQL
jgi:hypothetical protein